MATVLRILAHLLRGRPRLYLCYTTVSWRTCDKCLNWHGKIVAHPAGFLPTDNCPHEVQAFPVWQLKAFRERGNRMQRKAREELARREAFSQAVELLSTQPATAIQLLERASQVDVHIPEIEALVKTKGHELEDAALRGQLREVFLRGWKSKFAQERYERQPELARSAQEAWGVDRIRELLP